MEKNKIIFFDFDGVIVNTCQLSFEINKEMFSDLEYEEMVAWADGNVCNQNLRESYSPYHRDHYFEQYQEKIKSILPVEGIEGVFKKLNSMGYKLIIVSSSDEDSIDGFLKTYGLEKYFIEVMARKYHASKVEKLKNSLDKYKVKAQNTVLITDSTGDVKEAEEVKIKTIGVSWGIHSPERLKERGADFIAGIPEDIVDGVKQLLAA
jgi:phosphoglycolate phosphatase